MEKEILENLRADYRSSTLTEDQAHEDPFVQFEAWFSDALKAEIHEPNAMTLATADLNGKPFARIVLLKGYGPEGFIFYSSYESNKGKELEANPQAALVFAWIELERQVRIEGMVERLDKKRSAEYFHKRPRASQIGAIISPQSQVIPDRAFLEKSWTDFEASHPESELELPDTWGGFLLIPDSIEFWQGRRSRLHDRLLYSRSNSKLWSRTRLAP